MTDEIIELECPRCGNSHTYLLRVKRSPYLFGTSGNTKRFTRLFTCPKDKEDFQSLLEMKEDDRGTITSVDVIGIVKNELEGKKKSSK
jgi:hypothetical protein